VNILCRLSGSTASKWIRALGRCQTHERLSRNRVVSRMDTSLRLQAMPAISSNMTRGINSNLRRVDSHPSSINSRRSHRMRNNNRPGGRWTMPDRCRIDKARHKHNVVRLIAVSLSGSTRLSRDRP